MKELGSGGISAIPHSRGAGSSRSTARSLEKGNVINTYTQARSMTMRALKVFVTAAAIAIMLSPLFPLLVYAAESSRDPP